MLNKDTVKDFFKKNELNKEISGTVSWLFLVSVFLTIFLFVLNIVALYVSPEKVENFRSGETIFLGFFQISASNDKLSLSWCAYLVGILTIILTVVNCALYYTFFTASLRPYINWGVLMANLIISVVTCVLLFILNIFNKPIVDPSQLNIIVNGWNPDVSKLNSTIQFNYVYDISFITDGTKTLSSHKSLNIFNVIWIIGMAAFMSSYVVSLFMFLYYKQFKLTPFQRKAQYE